MAEAVGPFGRADTSRLMIFGHPSHELALFGVLQRYRPSIVIITDGGSPERLDQSRAGLASIDLLSRTVFLEYPESSFYEALLDRDAGFFAGIAGRLRKHILACAPRQIFCDAIEFYNPVHDVTLPMVRAALAGLSDVAVYEVPIVYQRDEEPEAYEIQRVPRRLAARRVRHEVAGIELDRKVAARDHVYANLREQAGPEFLTLPRAHLACEEMAVAGWDLPTPEATGRALRYERRARLLSAQGVIRRVITLADHYRPVASRLLTEGATLR